MQNKWIELANIFRFMARYPLLILGILVFLFALVSGSEGFGGGIMGIIKNSPNAIPWLALLLFVLVAWKWELIGGIIITVLGMAMFYFFNFADPNFFLFTFILTIIITILGSFFIVSWLLRRNEAQTITAKGLHKPGNQLLFYAVIVIIFLIFAGLSGYNKYQQVNKPPDKTSILQPNDGEQVNRQISMMGGLTKEDLIKDLWLVVQPVDSTIYHPQPGPVFKPPMRMWWYAETVYFGKPDDAPGKQYHVYLFSATEEASKMVKDYQAKSNELGQGPGLKALPDGLSPLDTITVTRK